MERGIMSVIVRVPGPLRRFAGGHGKLQVDPGTVREILVGLGEAHVGLQPRLFSEDGALQPTLRVFVGDTDVHALAGLDTQVNSGQVVSLLLPVAGA